MQPAQGQVSFQPGTALLPALKAPCAALLCVLCPRPMQRGTLDALDELDQMASMDKLRLAANWVVKLGDLKTSAASSMAKFPLHTVGGAQRGGLAVAGL